jgi:hypothetical protein
MDFASPNFFLFVVRRYSGVSFSQVCRKLAAGCELLDGLIQVASEYRLRGGALFGRREALFVATSCGHRCGAEPDVITCRERTDFMCAQS